jgi:hypothetical protein
MKSKLELKLCKKKPCRPTSRRRVYDAELDDVGSILADLCDELAESECVEFLVSGFGQDSWPVDVRVDLLTILEQLPSTALAIRSGAPEFRLDFYEQGLQRFLTFERSNDNVLVRCVGGLTWQPEPVAMILPFTDLSGMLDSLRAEFISIASAINPELARHPWLEEWDERSRLPT